MITQANTDDGEITPFREGFLDYMFGRFLHRNPYYAYGDEDIDDKRYYEWYDGWNAALKRFPEIEPKED